MSRIRNKITDYIKRTQGLLGDSFYHDPVMISILVLFFLLLVGLLLLLIFRVDPTVAEVPLAYNILFGVTYSAAWYGLYAYLVAILVLGAINFLIAWAYFDKERLISYLIACVTIILASLTILYVYNLSALIK